MSERHPIPGDDEKTHLLTELEEAETLLLLANKHITTLEQQLKDCKVARNAALSREKEANSDWSKEAKQWIKQRQQLKDCREWMTKINAQGWFGPENFEELSKLLKEKAVSDE